MGVEKVLGAVAGPIIGGLMGGMGGSKESGKTTNTSSNSPAPWLQAAGQDLYNRAQIAADRPYEANPYLKQAAYNPDQLRAQQMVRDQAASGNSTFNAANTNLTDTLNGKYLDPNSNPYLKGTVDQALGQVGSQVGSTFNMGGAFGSSANQELLANNLGQTANNMYSANYNNERQRQMQASALAPTFQNASYTNANALNQLGGQEQVYAQNDINNQSQGWQDERNYPLLQQSILANALRGAMGTQASTSTNSSPYFTNPMGNIIGGASAGMDLGNKISGLFGNSNDPYSGSNYYNLSYPQQGAVDFTNGWNSSNYG